MPFPDATPDNAWTRHAAASEQVQVAFTEGPAATLAAALTQSPEDEHHEGHAPSWKHLEGFGVACPGVVGCGVGERHGVQGCGE